MPSLASFLHRKKKVPADFDDAGQFEKAAALLINDTSALHDPGKRLTEAPQPRASNKSGSVEGDQVQPAAYSALLAQLAAGPSSLQQTHGGSPKRRRTSDPDAAARRPGPARAPGTATSVGLGDAPPSLETGQDAPQQSPQSFRQQQSAPLWHLSREVTAEAVEALSSTLEAADALGGAPGCLRQAWPEGAWALTGTSVQQQASAVLADLGVRERLITRWKAAYHLQDSAVQSPKQPQLGDFASLQQQALFCLCSTYKDVLLPERPYPARVDETDTLLDAVHLHCLRHVGEAAACIKANNDLKKSGQDVEVSRDQGFTRPKVLMLQPMRNLALKAVLRLCQLAQAETRTDSLQGKQRLLEEFGAGEEEPLKQPGQGSAKQQPLFAGNTDDFFRIGIKFTRGAVRLFADFYDADVIVASPLALATLLADSNADAQAGAADFLSSIEICVVDRADVMLMQNWAHVLTVFEALNGMPQQQRGADIMRVRHAYLDGWGRHLRQTIVLSSFAHPRLHALLHRYCACLAGRALLRPQPPGVLEAMPAQVRQRFVRLPARTPADAADARLQQFCRSTWPALKDSGAPGQLLFVPSYFDYVAVRNFLQSEGAEFACLHEYATPPELARARSLFADGRARLALLTERCYFYHRPRLRNVQDIIFYGLPDHPTYYSELVANAFPHAVLEGMHSTVCTYFSKFEFLQLTQILGYARATKLLQRTSSTFVLC